VEVLRDGDGNLTSARAKVEGLPVFPSSVPPIHRELQPKQCGAAWGRQCERLVASCSLQRSMRVPPVSKNSSQLWLA